MGSGFADAHLHIADLGVRRDYHDLDSAVMLFGCTSQPGDWGRMRDVMDSRVLRFYGLHPWYSDQWSDALLEELACYLSSDPVSGVGEIGLDSKHGGPTAQMPAFEAQMGLAERMGRPVNIHMVGCEKDVLETVRAHRGIPAVVIHSFSSESYVKPFSDLGCYMSLNPRILARSDGRLRRLVSSIPEELLLLESDAPYSPRGFSGMVAFAESLASRCGTTAERLLGIATDNAGRISYV